MTLRFEIDATCAPCASPCDESWTGTLRDIRRASGIDVLECIDIVHHDKVAFRAKYGEQTIFAPASSQCKPRALATFTCE